MEKKCFVALLMVVVMMCACWTGVLAEDVERETFTSGDYEYALLDDGTVEITGYNGKAEKLTIPNMLNGKKVTSIDNRAFYLCNSLISIIIPDSVEKISVNPFAYCRTLKSIFVSSEHPYFFAIDGVLFRKADSCLISYPKGREYTTYNIPQGITAIESSAFYDCKFLTRVTIPDSVTSIGDCAFSLCDSLTSITIPDSVEQIGTNPFTVCSALKSISVSPEHPYFATIDGVLFRKADKALISYPAGISSSTYTIPQGITAIGDSAFYYCDSLTSVSIPDSVTSIGDRAFYYCKSLTSVSIPDSVTAIGDSAFSYCDSLTSVSIPDSVTAIGDEAFYSCSSLTSVNIPDSVEQIGTNPFSSCSKLKTISVSSEHLYFATIDGVLLRKADKALISYPAGISSSTYTIPQGITAIRDGAFYSCDFLTSVSIPDSVTSIGDYAFSDCSSLTSVSIPASVTSIGDEVFYSCSSLTSVNIPDSVTSIGDRAFCYCDSLTSVSIPDSVTAIGNRAFYYCDSLTSVSIPNSVTSIGDYAFGDCSNLTLTVPRNSYAAEYAKTNNIPYTYPDANDWLNN
jgi:hypothetical protein